MEGGISGRFRRAAIRFEYRGIITVEDLWDLSLNELDELFRSINGELKVQGGDGLIKDNTMTAHTKNLQLQADLVRFVFEDKTADANAAKAAAVLKEKKKRILEIIAKKQDDALADKSIGELTVMLEDL